MIQRGAWLRPVLVWSAAYATVAALTAWSRAGASVNLVLAALALLSTGALLLLDRRQLSRPRLLYALVLLLGFGFFGAVPIAWQLQRLGARWEQVRREQDAQTRARLDRYFDQLLSRGRQAAALTARLPTADRRELFERLEQLRLETKVDAIAVFGDSGELRAWAGEHHGRIPNTVRIGPMRTSFAEGPLYSYLYVVQAHADSGRVTAGLLMRPLEGVNAAFLSGAGAPDDWALAAGTDTLLHARVELPTQAEWRQELLHRGQRLEVPIALLVVLALAYAWLRQRHRPARVPALVPVLGTIVVIAAAPIGSALGLEDIFSPGLFLLPAPGSISLGTMLVVLVWVGLFVASSRVRPRLRSTTAFMLLAVALAAALPLLLQVLIGPAGPALEGWRASTATLLRGGPALWVALQAAVVLLLTIAIAYLLMLARPQSRLSRAKRHRGSLILLGGSLAIAGALALGVLVFSQTRERVPPWLSVLWLAPILIGGLGSASYQRDGRRLVRWLLSGWIAATVTLPFVWSAQIDTLLRSAERELSTLGTRPDPYLDFLLRQFGREAIARRERGEEGLQLLYRSWVSSGLAQEAYPARITMWDSTAQPLVQLPLGDAFTATTGRLEAIPPYLAAAFVRVQELAQPEVFLAPETEQISQVLVVPLDQQRVVTVEVAPRRTFERTSVIAPLLGSRSDLTTRLELVPLRNRTVGGMWRPVPDGWRSEAIVHFPDADYHAHLELRLPSVFVQIARGALIVAADLLLLLLLWLGGRVLRGESVAPTNGWFGWLGSFRSRVTATLFAFFLLPTVVFGWVAYGALAREVVRAARIVAERAVRQAVVEFPGQGDLSELASHAGSEILLFFQGELASASSPEAIELGVFSVWMPPNVFLALDAGDEEAQVAPRTIAEQEFLTAYRRLQPAGTGIMAVPISLESSETVQRQREMLHLVLFAALVGGLLSLALSVAVGRALTGPIGRLQRAAAAIGAGRLNVQLPEQTGDEFGRLYASFNRMVRRLRRARAQELRTARVLAWGEMARQVAHEIKNPLTPIKLAVQHLRRAYADRTADFERVLDQSVDQILIEIDRLTDIARAFSRYGAPPESAGPLETVDVGAVVQEALTLYRTGDTRVSYIDEIESNLPAVFSRSGELKEVLLNLLENARDALVDGGRIVVSARREGLAVELCVRDNGDGIPADQLNRIFDPHFSTRSAGTGLGLPIVRRLVESWGGTVEAESEAGHGTTIRVRLRAVLENGTSG